MRAVKELSEITARASACDALGIPRASFYRWLEPAPLEPKERPPSPRALRPEERREVLEALNSERFADRAPPTVWAMLLDEGRYLCSVSTMYRILRDAEEVRERRDQLRHPAYKKPELLATGPNEVWSWDITKLLGPRKWTYYHLYVILDIFSRYVVGWLLAERESADLAGRLIRETVRKQEAEPEELTIHSDRGPSMGSRHVAQLLADLSVTKTHSRPHVSNDNPYSEAQFKTLKYRPEFPERFGSPEDARSFLRGFFEWYNREHRHGGIGYMTPEAVHYGRAEEVRRTRQDVLLKAYRKTPERFVTRPPEPPAVPQCVWINPPGEGAGSCGVGKEGEVAKRPGETAPGAQELVPPGGRSPRREPRERSELVSPAPLDDGPHGGDRAGEYPPEAPWVELESESDFARQSDLRGSSVSDVLGSTRPRPPLESGSRAVRSRQEGRVIEPALQ